MCVCMCTFWLLKQCSWEHSCISWLCEQMYMWECNYWALWLFYVSLFEEALGGFL
jgi:hypothetical protein